MIVLALVFYGSTGGLVTSVIVEEEKWHPAWALLVVPFWPLFIAWDLFDSWMEGRF